MEILMNLKCSTTPAHTSHTNKTVDRVQQQQQLNHSQRMSCLEYVGPPSAPTIDCYNYMGIRCCNNFCPDHFPSCCSGGRGDCCSGKDMRSASDTYTTHLKNFSTGEEQYNSRILGGETVEEGSYEYKEPEENFVSIDDVKIKGFLMKIGQERRAKQEQQADERQLHEKKQVREGDPSVVYEIIDLDDEEEREKLKRIKNQAEFKNAAHHKNQIKHQYPSEMTPPRQSPNINLVPAKQNFRHSRKQNTNEPLRIIAEIDLLDSSGDEEPRGESKIERSDDEYEPTQDEGNQVLQVMSDEEGNDALVPASISDCVEEEEEGGDEYVNLPLAAVSCELNCEDDLENKKAASSTNIVVLASDEEYIDDNEEGLEVRWEELELGQRSSRNNFECFVCGKKVQSNYNLRRHMMIHTGK